MLGLHNVRRAQSGPAFASFLVVAADAIWGLCAGEAVFTLVYYRLKCLAAPAWWYSPIFTVCARGIRLVTMERPAPIRSSWVTLRVGALHNAEPHAKEPVMSNVRFIGLDVHAETIAVAVAEPDGEVRSLGMIPNRPESIRKLVKKLGPADQLRVCYEAGPTGYVVYWQLTALGVKCEVVAPTLVPVKAGDRVKTDRRDALKLARSYRARDLTAVWVPDAAHEALRDLVRARE